MRLYPNNNATIMYYLRHLHPCTLKGAIGSVLFKKECSTFSAAPPRGMEQAASAAAVHTGISSIVAAVAIPTTRDKGPPVAMTSK